MKFLYGFILIIIASSAVGQDWNSSVSSARDAYKKGDFERAIRLYQLADKQKNPPVAISAEVGQAAYRSGDYTTAQQQFERAAHSGNKKLNASYYHNLGNSLMKQKKYSEAINAYKNSLKLSPSNKETQYNLSEAIRRNKNKSSNSPENKKDNQTPPQPKNNNQPPSPSNPNNNKNNLPSKSADRLLDQLMKAEAETKRKLAGSRQKNGGQNSGKDW